MTSQPLPFDPIEEARRQWLAHELPCSAQMAATTSIMRAQQVVLSAVENALRPMKLSFARYEALILLSFSRKGALPLSKMGARLMVHPTSITNTINKLEEQGLIRRVQHPTDRRMTLAQITPSGRRLAARASKALGRIQFGFPLSDAASDDVTDVLRPLRLAVGDFDAGDDSGRASTA